MNVRRDGLHFRRFFRRHHAVEAVHKAIANAQPNAVAHAIFRAPLRIHARDIQRKAIRLRAAFQMTTGAIQAATGVAPGIAIGFHYDVVAEHDITFVIVEHGARL